MALAGTSATFLRERLVRRFTSRLRTDPLTRRWQGSSPGSPTPTCPPPTTGWPPTCDGPAPLRPAARVGRRLIQLKPLAWCRDDPDRTLMYGPVQVLPRAGCARMPPTGCSAAARRGSRTCSRWARSAAVGSPPSGYLMTPAQGSAATVTRAR